MQVKQINTPLHTPLVTLLTHILCLTFNGDMFDVQQRHVGRLINVIAAFNGDMLGDQRRFVDAQRRSMVTWWTINGDLLDGQQRLVE
jgi:hypothetical protein